MNDKMEKVIAEVAKEVFPLIKGSDLDIEELEGIISFSTLSLIAKEAVEMTGTTDDERGKVVQVAKATVAYLQVIGDIV